MAGVVRSSGVEAPPGVAPGVELIAVKVLDRYGYFAWSSQVVAGLDWLLAERGDVDVVNMSLGTYSRYPGFCDDQASWILAFAEAIEGLRARGVLSFACPGNEADADMMEVPACVESAVAVGAVFDDDFDSFMSETCMDKDPVAGEVCCFSNYGPALDLVAPGAWITSSNPGDTTRTDWGTSYAAPHAAGAAALLVQLGPDLTADEVEEMLVVSGVPAFDARTGQEHPGLSVLDAIHLLPEDCANGSDDNYDGLADCADPLCEGEEGPIGQSCEPTGETTCIDLADNDGDGQVDCLDPSCSADPLCPDLDAVGEGCSCARASSSGASDSFSPAALLLVVVLRRR